MVEKFRHPKLRQRTLILNIDGGPHEIDSRRHQLLIVRMFDDRLIGSLIEAPPAERIVDARRPERHEIAKRIDSGTLRGDALPPSRYRHRLLKFRGQLATGITWTARSRRPGTRCSLSRGRPAHFIPDHADRGGEYGQP